MLRERGPPAPCRQSTATSSEAAVEIDAPVWGSFLGGPPPLSGVGEKNRRRDVVFLGAAPA
eukprot:8906096-Pyramimonas_sp.AAC.1